MPVSCARHVVRLTPPSPKTPPPGAARSHTPPMAARKLIVLAAWLLDCHSASALAVPFMGARLPRPALVPRSIGAQLASVDPAVWAAGAGVAAATIRLQQEALVRMRIEEIRGGETGRFGLHLKALSAVPAGLVGLLRSGVESRAEFHALSCGVLARCAFKLLGHDQFRLLSCGVLARCAFQFLLVLLRDDLDLFPGYGDLKLWPKMTRIIVLACASAMPFGECGEPLTFPSLLALGFLGSGPLFVV